MEQSTDLTQRECKFLNNMAKKMTSEIHESIQINTLEIANNLRCLNENVSQKFDNIITYTDQSIKQLCNYRIKERDNLHKTISEVKQNVQTVYEGNSKIMKEQEKFKKVQL